MEESVKQDAGDFALAQALILADASNLPQLHLNELCQGLEVISQAIFALRFDVSSKYKAGLG